MADRLCVGTDKGVITLACRQGAWTVETQALESWTVEDIAVHPDVPNRVLAGTRGDGVWVSEDGGKTWDKPSYGKPGPGKVRSMAFDPRDPRHVYAGGEPIEIYVSEDVGANWRRLDSVRMLPWVSTVRYVVAGVEPHVRDIAVDPNHPETIYAALQVGFMIKSTDGGATWELLDRALDPDVHTIAVSPARSDTVIAATGGGGSRSGKAPGRALYLSEDAGEHWTPVGLEFPQHYSVPLVVNPGDPSVFYSALAEGAPPQWRHRPEGAKSALIRSVDSGHTWHRLDQALPDADKTFAMAIAVDPFDPNHIYLGMGESIAYSPDGGESWSTLDIHTPAINDLKCVKA